MMGRIIVPNGCIQQPQQSPRINGGNALTDGLVCAIVALPGNVFYEVFTQQLVKNTGNFRIRQTIDGNAAAAVSNIGANASPELTFARQTGADRIAGPWTVFAESSMEVNATQSSIFRSYNSGNGAGFNLDFDDVNTQSNGLRAIGDVTGCPGALGTNSENFTHRLMATVDGSNIRYYTKRILQATVASATLPAASAGRLTYIISTVGASQRASASLILVWNKVLGLFQYQCLYDNPWQTLTVAPRALWSNAPATFQSAWAVNSTVTIQSARAA